MNATIKILQKSTFTKKDGTKNVFLRLTIKRKPVYLPLFVYTKPTHFKNGRITYSDPDHQNKNLLVEKFELRAKKIIFDCRLHDRPLNEATFKSDLFNEVYGSESFYDYVDIQIEKLTPKLTKGSLKNYKDQKNKLRSFRSELLISDIDLSFIQEYELYLIKERKNNKNTIIKSLTFIKTILNRALETGLIKQNPFKNYKLGRIEGHRDFLTISELNILEGIYLEKKVPESKLNVLRYFLFCCYTGMRHIDIEKLTHRDIIDDTFVKYKQTKTRDWVTVPLIDKSRQLMPKKLFNNQKIFKVISNQPTNRHLKGIMEIAMIDKQISFHCARHTFATLSKSFGMEYDVISRLLGHTDRKTTMIYAKYESTLLKKEMEKWIIQNTDS